MAARARVNGPAADVLTLWPGPGVWGGHGGRAPRPWVAAGGMSAHERRGDASFLCPSRSPPCGPLEASACDEELSVSGRPCRTQMRQAAIPSESRRHRRHHPRLHLGIPPPAPPHTSAWTIVPRAPDARGSPSSSSPLCLLHISASPRRRTVDGP